MKNDQPRNTEKGKMQAGSVIPARCPGFVAKACEILEELLED